MREPVPTNIPNNVPIFAANSGVISILEKPVILESVNSESFHLSSQTRFLSTVEPPSIVFRGQILTPGLITALFPTFTSSPMKTFSLILHPLLTVTFLQSTSPESLQSFSITVSSHITEFLISAPSPILQPFPITEFVITALLDILDDFDIRFPFLISSLVPGSLIFPFNASRFVFI